MTTCALVGASDFNEQDFLARFERGAFDEVLAVDAGYAWLQRIGVVPDLALGDFDSLGFVPQDVPCERHRPEKDDSDMGLALESAARAGHDALVVYGGLGGRLDHTIANLQELARFSERGLVVAAIGDGYALRLLTGPGAVDLPPLDAGTVSVFSACDQAFGVTEAGMAYHLENFTLANRTSLGLSNELMGRPARISVERGTLYIVCPLAALPL